jgi:hypothetical protein
MRVLGVALLVIILLVRCNRQEDRETKRAVEAASDWLGALAIGDTNRATLLWAGGDLRAARLDEVLRGRDQTAAFKGQMATATAIVLSPESIQVVVWDRDDHVAARRVVLTMTKTGIIWKVRAVNRAKPIG